MARERITGNPIDSLAVAGKEVLAPFPAAERVSTSALLYPPRIVFGGKVITDWCDPIIRPVPWLDYLYLSRYSPGLIELKAAVDEAVFQASGQGRISEVGGTRRRVSFAPQRIYSGEELLAPHLWLHAGRILNAIEKPTGDNQVYGDQAARVMMHLRENMLNHDLKAQLDKLAFQKLPPVIVEKLTETLSGMSVAYQVKSDRKGVEIVIPDFQKLYAPWTTKGAFYRIDQEIEDDPEYLNIQFVPSYPISGYRLRVERVHPAGNSHPEYEVVGVSGCVIDSENQPLDYNLMVYISPWPTGENGRLQIDQRAGRVSKKQNQAVHLYFPGQLTFNAGEATDELEADFPLADTNRAYCYLIRMTHDYLYGSKKRHGFGVDVNDLEKIPKETKTALKELRRSVVTDMGSIKDCKKDEALATIIGMLAQYPFAFTYFGKLNGFARVYPRAAAAFTRITVASIRHDDFIVNVVEMPGFDLSPNGSFSLRNKVTGIEKFMAYCENCGIRFPEGMSILAKICWLFEIRETFQADSKSRYL